MSVTCVPKGTNDSKATSDYLEPIMAPFTDAFMCHLVLIG